MSGKEEESLSALMDGELSGASQAAAVDRLVSRADLRERWCRYHLVRAVLRGELDARTQSNLLADVRRSLAAEPVHVAPARRAVRLRRAVLAPVAGLALAASVAALAVLAIRGQNGAAPQQVVETAPATAVTASPVAALRVPVAVAPPAAQLAVEARPADFDGQTRAMARPAMENRLNRYLVRHSEYLGGGMRGLLPYARIVGQEQPSRGR